MGVDISVPGVLVAALSCLVVVFIYFCRSGKKTYGKLPPMCQGWIPWLGCAIEFGKAPLQFINDKQRELGDIFTLCVAGERLTFLTQAEDFPHFFQSSNVDFQKAVQDPVKRVASVTEESFFKYHTKIHDTVKGKLAAAKLLPVGEKLFKEFQTQLDSVKPEAEGELLQLVRRVMYKGVINNLFGRDVLPTGRQEDFMELEKHFVLFDDQFEYGSKLPSFFLGEWTKSKMWLLALFSGIIKKQEECLPSSEEEKTLLQSLIEAVDRPHAPNYGLLLLWASLANAIPITFWTLSFLCSDEDLYRRAVAEVQAVLQHPSKCISEEELRRMPLLKCCMLEAIRLRSPGVITRRVTADMQVKGFTIPVGDMIMVSPYWAHRNPKYFPDPDRFHPDRWMETDLEKNVFLDGFIAFGGGRYQCPGRWFALLEIQMFVAMFLQRFHLQALESVPDPSPLHVVGTQQPLQKFPIVLTRRDKS